MLDLDMGLRPMLPVPEECPKPWLEPQAGLPDLPRAGAEPQDQAAQTAETGEARRVGRARTAERSLVHGLHGRSPRGRSPVPAAECPGRLQP